MPDILPLPSDQAGRLPCLRVGRKLLFELATIERELAERAATGRQGGSDGR